MLGLEHLTSPGGLAAFAHANGWEYQAEGSVPALEPETEARRRFQPSLHPLRSLGYERDALYVFTPDLMGLLIDETGDLDVEIRDDQLFVYHPGGFDLGSVHTWARTEAS